MFKNVFITGGAGYCGSVLTRRLLDQGYCVTVYDIQYFGSSVLPLDHPMLTVVQGDIRDIERVKAHLPGHDAFIHLACISNDASFELDEALSTTTNLDAFEPLVIAAKAAGVKRFIYASSSSVYGVSDSPDVTEDHPLAPLTLYSKFKGMCELLLLKHTNKDFVGVTFRPATVCGYSPRQRLDLSVNILTNHAVTNNRITVFGGAQLRPNLHILDYCDAVTVFLTAPDAKIADQIFNVGYQNMSIADIAELARTVVEAEFPAKAPIQIVTTPSDDNRSYHINSDKIAGALGYAPSRTIEDAVRDLCQAFQQGRLPDSMQNDWYYNVRTMKALAAK
jgi:nucleoside-diphosphate-sugar epimerase